MRTLIVSPSVMGEFQRAVDPGFCVPFNLQVGGCTMFTDTGDAHVIVDRCLPGFTWLEVETPRPPYIVHMQL